MNDKVGYEKNIGKKIVSKNFGMGEIVGVDDLGLKEGLFYVIRHNKQQLKSYLSIKNNNNFRIIIEKETYLDFFSKFKFDKKRQVPDTKKDRLEYFKNTSGSEKLDDLLNTAKDLKSLNDLTPAESVILRNIIDSLVLEHSVTLELEYEESKKFIVDLVSKKK